MKHGQSYGRYSDVKFLCYFLTNNQPSYGQGFFFPIVPWDWCPHYYKNPLHVQLPMICLFYAIYYIIFIRILDYVIFLKKKLPQGLYFEKKLLFFFCIYRKRVRFSIILFINNFFHHSLQRIFFSLNILIRYFIYFYCALFWI